MKALSRLASPAGFALVLLLFLLLPFLSVSCEVPGMGKIGADYTGGHLVVGDEPEAEVPSELSEMTEELPGTGSGESEPPPDPGVQVLAIITAVVMAAGIGTIAISRARSRLIGAAGVAALAGVLVVVTQVVAQSNLTDQLEESAGELAEGETPVENLNEMAGEMIHTEVGFWLTLIGLVLIALLSVGFIAKDKIFRRLAPAAGGAPPPEAGGGQNWVGQTPPATAQPAGPPPAGHVPDDAPTNTTANTPAGTATDPTANSAGGETTSPAANPPAGETTGPTANSAAGESTGPAANAPTGESTGPTANSAAGESTGPAANSSAGESTGPAATAPTDTTPDKPAPAPVENPDTDGPKAGDR